MSMYRMPAIYWLADRTHTESGDPIETPALRGFVLMEPVYPLSPGDPRPNDIYRQEILIRHSDRNDPELVALAVGRAWIAVAESARRVKQNNIQPTSATEVTPPEE